MAHSIRFLQPIRVRTTTASFSSIHSSSRILRNFQLLKSFEPPAARYTRPLVVNWKLYVHRYLHSTKSYHLGHEFSAGRLLGLSTVLGSFFLRPRFAHCMDGYSAPVDDHSISMLDKSETDEILHSFLIYAKKLMVPIFLLLIVWMNWDHPVVLAVKVILTLLSTKPSPFSVYVFIKQLQRQYKDQHPLLHRFKSLYAKKVEVEDYTFLCVARVEIGDHKYTLLGILGGWWVFETTSLRSALSGFRNRTLEILETAVSSET